ncbi:hypothetical protein SLS56_003553 [Neofusicoccum ribis]|uniref:FAD-binding domain-containing protein n=1 Tax=Neofusicoccum ribis TaxID=45134 RepID=A0ABR3SYS9_9PEZI
MQQSPDSGISVLVVGGGLAGLATAIESYRKGHQVRVVDRRPNFNDFGDLIGIGPSALRTPEKWPGFLERVRAQSYTPMNWMFKYDNTLLCKVPTGQPDYPSLLISRADLHRQLYAYATELQIPIEFGKFVEEYHESDEKAFATTSDGETLEADVIIAADGVGSRSWKLVMGKKDQPISSGFAVYRVDFPIGPALKNPLIAAEFADVDDRVSVHIGPDAHVVIGKKKDHINWMMTYKDDGNADESWTKTAQADKALKHVAGWTPFLTELIEATPNNTVIDWKLMWRNPQPQWTSPKARVIQVGDSAHSFLPSSGSGATMAWEDAFSIAACLQLGGKKNIPVATRVHNLLRFERVSCAQKMGYKTRELWHKTDWEAVSKNPNSVGNTLGNWVLRHDPEQYAREKYEDASNSILTGAPFKNTNAVPGYTYKP